MPKMLNNSYLYQKYPEYEKAILKFLYNGQKIDTEGDDFEDIRYDVKKRQISNALAKVLTSKNVVLITETESLPKQLKVFVAKDIKGDRKHKIFIDCTDLIHKVDGEYVCRNTDVLIAYLVNAMTCLVYYGKSNVPAFATTSDFIENATEAFAKLFTAVIDYIYKISINGNLKSRCMYLASIYFITNILEKDYDNTSNRVYARKIAGISEREEEIIELGLEKNSFINIKYFIDTVARDLHLNKLTLDVVVARWMYMYGTGTVLALELLPSFCSMLTDAYVGCFLNNQKTIEKIATKSFVTASKSILRIGEERL